MPKISIFVLINGIFAAETIQGRKLFKGRKYVRKYGICNSLKKKLKNTGIAKNGKIKMANIIISYWPTRRNLEKNTFTKQQCLFCMILPPSCLFYGFEMSSLDFPRFFTCDKKKGCMQLLCGVADVCYFLSQTQNNVFWAEGFQNGQSLT